MKLAALATGAIVLLVGFLIVTRGPATPFPAGPNDLRVESTWTSCDVSSAVVRMGSAEGQGAYLFFGVEDARFLPDGGAAVLNRSSKQIRLFDSSGRFVRTLGGRGDGPGELRDPIAIDLLRSDSIAVWDWSQGRITVYAWADGGHRSVLLSSPAVNPTGSFGTVDRGEKGTTFLIGSNPQAHFGGDTEGGHHFLHILQYSSQGHLLDTLRVLPYGRSLWVDEANREVGQPWFQPRGLFHVRDGLLYTATGDTSQVQVTALTGPGAERTVNWTSPDRGIRPEHLQAHRAETFRRFEGNEYLTQRLQKVWNTMPSANRFPALGELIADEAGRTWIKQYPRPDQSSQAWWLFDVDGDFQCAARFPNRFDPLDFRGESVLGLFKDSLDIEFIEVRSITPPTDG
ncbi:MAG: 6-bladed beta-propeller [Dehalococcoidia bacterium]